jgi:HK97 family phage portal protein
MGLGSFLSRTLSSFVKKGEGDYRPGPYQLPVTGGWLSADVGSNVNWWQLGYDPINPGSYSAIVEACISAYSQTVAMLPGDHWRLSSKGGRDRVTNSALARILRKPNVYQTISDFMLNLTRSLYLEGNAYAVALRNDRYEVSELHLMNPRLSLPQVVPETGEVFYRLGGNDVVSQTFGPTALLVPQRDVLHVRLHTSRWRFPYPLMGETPIAAAMGDIVTATAITNQQIAFYSNQARPSAVLSTDLQLDKDQVQALRDRWNEQVKGLQQGGTPILTSGLKVQPWGTTANDSQLAETAKMSAQNIALAYRVPLSLLGIGGTAYSSTEVMMQAWIASGLGFALNHIEEAFGLLFALKGQPDEYVEFDTAALLRSAMKDRIDALSRGVQGGIYSPNEAREREGLDRVKFGEEPRVQQQVVPLSAAGAIPAAPGPGAPPSAAGVPMFGKPPADNADKPPPAKQDGTNSDNIQREVRNILRAAARTSRRRTS